MRTRGPDWHIDSAGTGGWHSGEPPDPRAIAEGARRGYDLNPLRARQIRQDDFGRFDLVVAMDAQNLRQIRAIQPCASKTQIRRLLGDRDVPDPYYNGGFSQMFDLIELGCRNLLVEYDAN